MHSVTLPKSGVQSFAKAQAKCGICTWDRVRVFPDKRKGLLSISQVGRSAAHVSWGPRDDSGLMEKVEEKVIVCEDAYLEKISQCSGGRVYVLRFTNNDDKKLIFWMQEPNESDDQDFVTKFNAIAKGRAKRAPLTGAGPSAAAAASPRVAGGFQIPPNLTELMSRAQAGPTNPSSAGVVTSPTPKEASVALRDVLNYDVLAKLLEDPAAMTELRECMPPGLRSDKHIRNAFSSSQMRSASDELTEAIYSDQYKLLVASLGLGQADPNELLNMRGFVNACNTTFNAEAKEGNSTGTVRPAGPRSSADEPPCKVTKTDK